MSKLLPKSVLNAGSYRDFMVSALADSQGQIPRGTLAKVSFRAGFSSRSFLTEVLQGKKRLTPSSLPKIAFALGLKGDLRNYFEYLVALEEEDIFEHLQIKSRKALSESDIRKKLGELGSRLELKSQFSLSDARLGQQEHPVLSLHVISVYAALGPLSNGATIREIQKRTSLEESDVRRTLALLKEGDFVTEVEDRFRATRRALDLQELDTDSGIVAAARDSHLEVARNVEAIAASRNDLIFVSALPIRSTRLKEFKERLRSAVLDVLDEFQEDEHSDVVVKKICMATY